MQLSHKQYYKLGNQQQEFRYNPVNFQYIYSIIYYH